MTVKAKLKMRLYAGDVLVAESEDAALWQRVLAAITAGKSEIPEKEGNGVGGPAVGGMVEHAAPASDPKIAKLAELLDVSAAVVIGACGPSISLPYIHLESRYWESFKKSLPGRGPGSVSPIQLALTLLGLWFDIAGLGQPSQSDANAVLEGIHIKDKNASRSVKNCDWLVSRGNGVVINPAEISRAIEIARAYCIREKGASKKSA